MLIRIVIASVLIGSMLVFQSRYHIFHFATDWLLYFACVVAGLSGIYWYLLRTLQKLPLLAYFQVGGDIVLISWLVTLTGVIDSNFSILYHVAIISASIILYRRGGYLAASLASILYGSMLDMQHYNLFGYVRSQNFTSQQVLYLLLVNILSFYLVAFLSGYLSERLRRTRQELRKKSSDFEDLRVLNDHILRSVGSGIVTMDLSGQVTSWNNGAENITGYALEEIRKRWRAVFGDSIKGLFGQTDELKAGPVRFEGQIVKQNGVPATLGFTATLLRDEHEQVNGIIVTFQDITRLIEMEDRMRRQERLASVGSLAAGIAHEIRNPLASLSGSIQMLREELHLHTDSKHLMDIVLRETDRLNMIITEFLDYARPRPFGRERVDLDAILSETLVLFRNGRECHDGIAVRTEMHPGVAVMGDAQRIRQVFWNLLINAAQAIDGRGTITVSAAPGEKGLAEEVIIVLADDGAGMPADNLKKIFDPFFTTKTNGTGLGLAIVYRIIEDHGGSISVTSRQGRGTSFTIRLPMALPLPPASPVRISLSGETERTS